MCSKRKKMNKESSRESDLNTGKERVQRAISGSSNWVTAWYGRTYATEAVVWLSTKKKKHEETEEEGVSIAQNNNNNKLIK